MMYEILNKLFGWNYVAWANSADSGIARVHVDGAGQVYYWRYKCTKVLDIIGKPEQVRWLTCPPSIYFENKEMYHE